MALITAFFLFLVGALGTAVSRLLTDEFKEWIPWIIQRVIRSAILRLPLGQRERFEEEWQSHVNELPGEIGKLTAALGFLTAARKMTLAAKEKKAQHMVSLLHRFASALLLILAAPTLVSIALASLISTGRVFDTTEQIANDRRFKRREFPTSGRLGKYLYRTRINEFPLLFNVVRGELSLGRVRFWWKRDAEGHWY